MIFRPISAPNAAQDCPLSYINAMAVFDEDEDWALSVAVQETKHLMANSSSALSPTSTAAPPLPAISPKFENSPSFKESPDILQLRSVQDALYECLTSSLKTSTPLDPCQDNISASSQLSDPSKTITLDTSQNTVSASAQPPSFPSSVVSNLDIEIVQPPSLISNIVHPSLDTPQLPPPPQLPPQLPLSQLPPSQLPRTDSSSSSTSSSSVIAAYGPHPVQGLLDYVRTHHLPYPSYAYDVSAPHLGVRVSVSCGSIQFTANKVRFRFMPFLVQIC